LKSKVSRPVDVKNLNVYTSTGLNTVSQRVTDTQTGEWDVLTRPHYITVTAAGGELVTRTITYTYDGLYRLVEADYSGGENFQYAYDAVGNRTAYTATITSTVVTTYSYDAANRLTCTCSAGASVSTPGA